MRKYLSYFEKKDQALSYDGQLGAPHVAYVEEGEQLLFVPYTEGVEEVKFKLENGQLTLLGEVDPVPGFVDLGLSVMWASCDVGATSPEGEGTKYAWGQESWETIPLEFDPVYMNSDMELKEVLRPRTPSPAQVQELLDNTTATEEVLNGVSGVRYTASNGNSIFVSDVFRWTNAEKYLVNAWSTYEAACWRPSSGIIDNTHTYNTISGTKSAYTMKEYHYPFRGVCSNLPQGGAQVLTLGQEIQVQEDALYCFPKTWTAAQFVASTTQPVAMYVSNTADFTASDTDANVLDVFAADRYNNQRIVYLSSVEIADLAEQATDEYIYVRFSCPASTVIAIDSWEASTCAGESYMIRTNEATRLVTNTFYKIYRLRYSDIQGTDLTIKWTGNGTVTPYISDTCSFLFSEAQYLLLNPAPTIRRRGSYTVTAAEINAWESRVGEDGYIFMHLDATSAGNITFAVEKPADVDPVSTTSLTSTDCGCTN